MHSLRPLIPILTAAGILLGGNGLQGTLIALRGAQEGFSPASIGFMGTAYFAGFLIGCLIIVRMMRAVGHIRAFSALAAIAACATLVMATVIDVSMWTLARFASGICFAGLFTIMESWLNSGVANADRARVLALYRIIDLGAVTGSQFLIPLVGPEGFPIFAVMAMMITLSLVPVSLADRSNPAPPEDVKLNLRRAWEISPIAAIGCVAIGVTNSAFRTMSPVYAQDIGMSVTDVATFVSVSIIGGALIQYPLGYVSDRGDRRTALVVICLLAAAAAVGTMLPGGQAGLPLYALCFVFGGLTFAIYPLCMAHLLDHLEPSDTLSAGSSLLLLNGVGSAIGPALAGVAMTRFGAEALPAFQAAALVLAARAGEIARLEAEG